MSQYLPLIIELCWLIILLLFLHRFLSDIHQINKVRGWKKALAEIRECEMIEKGSGHWISLLYRFEIDETYYESEQIFVRNFFVSPFATYCKWQAYHLVLAYKGGEKIDVYYDPRCPSNSVLARPHPTKLYIITLLLLFFTGFHLVLLFSKLTG